MNEKKCSICGNPTLLTRDYIGLVHTDALPVDLARVFATCPRVLLVCGPVCDRCKVLRDDLGLCIDILRETANTLTRVRTEAAKRVKAEEEEEARVGTALVDLYRSVAAWYQVANSDSHPLGDPAFKLCPVCSTPFYAEHKSWCFIPQLERVGTF